MASDGAVRERAPIRDGLLSGSLSQLDGVRLTGCKCTSCGETSLGKKSVCPNCGRDTVHEAPLSDRGVLWSFTVVRHRPPGAYMGPEPFRPFGLGLVELPDGLRVLSPIQCEVDKLKIGLELRFKPYLRHDAERDVVAFAFEPVDKGGSHV
ncbi:MAG: OB-fold domain-containing protein [Roseiarcus sp.]